VGGVDATSQASVGTLTALSNFSGGRLRKTLAIGLALKYCTSVQSVPLVAALSSASGKRP
jgi:hypothetical protein